MVYTLCTSISWTPALTELCLSFQLSRPAIFPIHRSDGWCFIQSTYICFHKPTRYFAVLGGQVKWLIRTSYPLYHVQLKASYFVIAPFNRQIEFVSTSARNIRRIEKRLDNRPRFVLIKPFICVRFRYVYHFRRVLILVIARLTAPFKRKYRVKAVLSPCGVYYSSTGRLLLLKFFSHVCGKQTYQCGVVVPMPRRITIFLRFKSLDVSNTFSSLLRSLVSKCFNLLQDINSLPALIL